MDLNNIKDILHKDYGYEFVSDNTHALVALWRAWWEGFDKRFHQYKTLENNALVDRKIYSLGMAKRISEDWTSVLLSPETEIQFEDKATAKYMLGDDKTGESGLLDDLKLWDAFCDCIEDAFWSGTGVAVVHFDKATLSNNSDLIPSENLKIRVEYLPADFVIPLSVEAERVTEIAIVSEFTKNSTPYAYLELHRKDERGNYVITNRFFKTSDGMFSEIETPEGMLSEYNTGATVPLFAVLTPNVQKNVPIAQGLGMSIYANAIDQLQAVDLAFNNFCADFKLGGKKVFYTQDMVHYDAEGHAVTPDDVSKQLFLQIGNGDNLDEHGLPIKEYNPSLRVDENTTGIQKALDYLSFKTGLGTKHYQFDGGSVVTATQYHGDKQELVQHAAKHSARVDSALKDLLRAIMWVEKNLHGAQIDPETQITIKFSDNYIVDPDAQRERDRQDVRDGLMLPWEYRVKWYGDSEEDAKAILSNNEEVDPFNLAGGEA